MAKWTKKYIKKQLNWTNECYRKALLEKYPFLSDRAQLEDLLALKTRIVEYYNLPINSTEITELYYKHLRYLETRQLNLILEAYQKGKQYRSGETMDIIMTELLERSANPEPKE